MWRFRLGDVFLASKTYLVPPEGQTCHSQPQCNGCVAAAGFFYLRAFLERTMATTAAKKTRVRKTKTSKFAGSGALLGVFDGGNHGALCHFGDLSSTPRVVRSLYTPLPPGKAPRRSSAASPIVEVDGRRFHVGSESALYDGAGAVAVGDKTDQTKLMFLASVPNQACGQEIDLVALHHSPNDREAVRKIKNSLRGEHNWTRNGVDLSINVQSVEVELEGAGTWHLIHPEGEAEHWSLIVDVGGGTWSAAVCDKHGIVDDHIVTSNGGTIALARQIARDTRLSSQVQARGHTHVDLSAVMTGLENGHCYVDDPSLTWEPWLGDYLQPWWDGIRNAAKSQFHYCRSRIGEVIVTGGGAHLAKDLIRNSVALIVPSKPHVASARGTWEHHNRRMTNG